MTCQGRVGSCNKCTTMMGNVDNGGGYACVGHGVYGKSLYLTLNFAVNLKLLLKGKVLRKKIMSRSKCIFLGKSLEQ